MVGTCFSKCLQCRGLSSAFVLLSVFSLFADHVAFGRGATGSSVTAEQANAPLQMVDVTPEAISFVDVPEGDVYTQTVKITNLGERTLQIKKISTSSADFRIAGILLPVVVAHGTSETFTVSFRAKAEGRREGHISIFTSSDDLPLVLKVRGSTVAAQNDLTVSTAAIDFEDVAMGSTSTQAISLTNVGTRDLTISGISVARPEFSVSGATAVRLTPGQCVSLEVSFAPKSAGPQSTQLTVASAEGSSLAVIPVTGSGAASSRNAVKLNWEGSPVTVAGYVVYRSSDSSGPYTRVSHAMAPEYIDTGLAAGHTYYYVVTSLDADEVESEYSPPMSATVPEG
jgi:hypothetical protein